jgi:tagatose-6-phosphate ketose/aldose isomerase
MSEAVLGLRYGPMAALDRQTLFICCLSEERRKTLYARDIRSELGERGLRASGWLLALRRKRELAPYCESYLAVHDEMLMRIG